MSEITREQVERAIDAMKRKRGMWHVMADALGNGWATPNGPMRVPPDVHLAWRHGDWFGTVAAMERWLSTFPPAKVARWDAEAGIYALSPGHPLPHGAGHCMEASLAMARDWGYTIEGGPEVAEDSPERLKARREALGLSELEAAAEDCLLPALNPALHETARKTVAWLRGTPTTTGLGPKGCDRLPGYRQWCNAPNSEALRWATQLEQLLGDAGT